MADYTAKARKTGITMQCPVRVGLKRDGSDLWTFPYEPTVSARGRKVITKRTIAKSITTGSVKEQWAMDDWDITIEGMFIAFDEGKFPESDVAKLKSLFVKGQSLVIRCKLLDTLGVGLICIESIDLPATPGLENQAFTISALSDQDFDLVI